MIKMTKGGKTATATRRAFEKVWSHRGWTIVGEDVPPREDPVYWPGWTGQETGNSDTRSPDQTNATEESN